MGVPKHIQEHAAMRYPKVDDNGNLIAEVTPRARNLADLLLVGDAGIGEIATALDEDCVVIYKDDGAGGSIGVPHFRNGKALSCYISNTTSPAQNVVTPLVMSASSKSAPSGAVDTASGYIDVPAYIYNDTDQTVLIELHSSMGGYGFSAGANVTINLESYDAVNGWTNIHANANITSVVDGAGLLNLQAISSISVAAFTDTRIRATALNDGASTGSLLGDFHLNISKNYMS